MWREIARAGAVATANIDGGEASQTRTVERFSLDKRREKILPIVAMSLTQVLEKYRKESFNEREKGTKFEELIKRFFLTDGRYEPQLENVWLWSEFPFNKDFGAGQDMGIDLVAKTIGGEYWAIQCKCYKEDHTFSQSDVASFLATSGKKFRDGDLKWTKFSQRVWVATTLRFGRGFKEATEGQDPPVMTIGLNDLEESGVDWDKLEEGVHGEKARKAPKELFDFQQEALDKTLSHFKENDRGRLIMACGTGKTFTALKIAEAQMHETNATNGGLVLCLVPSIALVGQMLREWAANAKNEINAVCVCSDASVSRQQVRDSNDEDEYERIEDLALPASTDPSDASRQIWRFSMKPGMTVVFSTYHSIDVISKAQKRLEGIIEGNGTFDLVICDEAHRTTGVKLAKDEEKAFIRVHYDKFIRARKRLYMTATPRIYGKEAKGRAEDEGALLCSMDNEELYGKEIYRLGFSAAVEKGRLSDYKVLVLTVREDQVSPALIQAMCTGGEIPVDDIGKAIGCINALSKRMLFEEEVLVSSDPHPMRRAVAFCRTIQNSKDTADFLRKCQEKYFELCDEEEDLKSLVELDLKHIDGTMSARERDASLNWLKSTSEASEKGREICRVLTNVRCLSEGVDVPALDAVLFLSPKNSQIDVVQSVGRVMRKSEGKKYGYIIIPIVVQAGVKPEDVLDKNERFRVVWQVLNALRSHDDSFDSMVEEVRLTKNVALNSKKIIFNTIPDRPQSEDPFKKERDRIEAELNLKYANQLRSELYAKMVEKVGNRGYWVNWARDVGDIAEKHVDRIKKLIKNDEGARQKFDEFHKELCQNINPELKEAEVIEMLSQHIVSRPVFEAIFSNSNFTKNNAISKSMSKMLEVLETETSDEEKEERKKLESFYASVRRRVEEIGNNPVGRQKIIIELYDKFFKTTSKTVVDKLGIVYTPTEVVDFLVHSAEAILKKEFGMSLADKDVHILDPFTGTGTFITRLLQSGLIPKEDLLRKYKKEIHANEIVLLAYYIACVNIENTFEEVSGSETYESFPGACLTDTFQLGEGGDDIIATKVFPENSERVIALKKTPIRVILGNPPYSVGQKSGNDNAQNQHYKNLEKRIEETYAAKTSARVKALYDSYVKAFRWASDRLDESGGIVAFVTNGGWLDGRSFDGFRKCLEEEFSKVYVFNLRGNARTQGELRKREGGSVFGSGTKTPITMTILVKNKKADDSKAQILYRDVGDYLKEKEKLKIISDAHDINFRDGKEWVTLVPNKHGDWIKHRNEKFDDFLPLMPEKKFDTHTQSIFVANSSGVVTSRDAWALNFSRKKLCENMERAINFYNSQVERYQEAILQNKEVEVMDIIDRDPKNFSWDVKSEQNVKKGVYYKFSTDAIRIATYRPFQKQNLYFARELSWSVYRIPRLFPNLDSKNLLICAQKGGAEGFSCFITNVIPEYLQLFNSQCFPLYYYEEEQPQELFDRGDMVRRDGISDFALKEARKIYGNRVSREDIFYYVYGILHSPNYRKEFDTNLRIGFPKVPFVESSDDFWEFSKAGEKLANLHLNYETLQVPEDIAVVTAKSEKTNFRVSKMRFDNGAREESRPSKILYNDDITIEHIPSEAYDYVVNGKSAIKWVMEQYQVTTDKKSGIVNDPNLWCEEHDDPEYIVNLLRGVIYLSCETVKIVKSLPKLDFSEY